MATRRYQSLNEGAFRESFLMGVEQLDWPNDYAFAVWSARLMTSYKLTMQNVLEYHFMRIGTGRLVSIGEGIPLDDIYVVEEDDFSYWTARIAAFAEQGCDPGDPPVCIEFSSHLFANRRRELLTRDRDTGLLVVCRSLKVERDGSRVPSPRPAPPPDQQ